VHESIVDPDHPPQTVTKESKELKSRERRYSDGDFQPDEVPDYLNTEDKRVVQQFNHDVVRSENTTVRKVTQRHSTT
jgi:phosphatidylinositol 4-kinase B